MDIRLIRYLFLTTLVLMPALIPGLALNKAEAAPYRSKLLLEPGQSLDEAAELSIEQMEAQFKSLQDDYARASTGMQLAQHYLQKKEYDKAIEYYQQALAAKGLSEPVNRQLRQQLAAVYLMKKDASGALRELQQLDDLNRTRERDVAMMYAQVYFLQKDYLATARALDKVMQLAPDVEPGFHSQVLALSFSIGDFSRAETVLKHFLERQPDTVEYWFQLVSVYLKQEKTAQALAVMRLAQARKIEFSEQNLLLYTSLLATEHNLYQAAEILQGGLSSGRIDGSGEHYRTLFEYWYKAQETDRALTALQEASTRSGDVELYLFQAQLLMQRSRWQDMRDTLLQVCKQRLPAQHVGEANLLLGVSELKLGNTEPARQAFVNATLVGGATDKAAQWLHYLDAQTGQGQVEYNPRQKASGPCRQAG